MFVLKIVSRKAEKQIELRTEEYVTVMKIKIFLYLRLFLQFDIGFLSVKKILISQSELEIFYFVFLIGIQVSFCIWFAQNHKIQFVYVSQQSLFTAQPLSLSHFFQFHHNVENFKSKTSANFTLYKTN